MTKDKIKENYSANVKKIRIGRKQTQTEFANDLNIKRQTFAAIEEKRSQSFDIAVKISEISGFSLDRLIKTKI